MDITPLIRPGSNLITAYGEGSFSVNNARIEHSLFLLPSLFIPLDVSTLEELVEHALPLIDMHKDSIDTMLIGCGRQHAAPPPALATHLQTMRIGYDSMNTGAACRTYNVLLSEERNVAALLFLIPIPDLS